MMCIILLTLWLPVSVALATLVGAMIHEGDRDDTR